MNDIFQRAAANLALAPWERALLKIVWGAIIAGLVAAIGFVAAVAAHDPSLASVSWVAVAGVFIITAFDALSKLLAKSNVPLAATAAPVVEAAGAQLAADVATLGKPLPKNPS